MPSALHVCLSSAGRSVGIQMCGCAEDSRQTNMMVNGSTSAGPMRPFEAHQPSSKSNAATGRPSAPTGTTHSDTENPSALGRRQESPSHRAIAVPAENMYTTADVLRGFGGSIACKEVWSEAACTRWLQATRGGGARIEHEVVADPKLRSIRDQDG